MQNSRQPMGATEAQDKAGLLSHDMREKLVAHAAGPRQLVVGCRTTKALQGRGLIRYPSRNKITPSETMLTEQGRQVVCVILGQYADALTAAKDFLERFASQPIAAAFDRVATIKETA